MEIHLHKIMTSF